MVTELNPYVSCVCVLNGQIASNGFKAIQKMANGVNRQLSQFEMIVECMGSYPTTSIAIYPGKSFKRYAREIYEKIITASAVCSFH